MAMGGKMNSLRDILAARVGDGRSKQVGRRMQGQSAPMPKPPKPAGAMMGSAPAPMPQAPAPMPQMAPRNVSFAGEPMQAQLPRERMQPASAPPKMSDQELMEMLFASYQGRNMTGRNQGARGFRGKPATGI